MDLIALTCFCLAFAAFLTTAAAVLIGWDLGACEAIKVAVSARRQAAVAAKRAENQRKAAEWVARIDLELEALDLATAHAKATYAKSALSCAPTLDEHVEPLPKAPIKVLVKVPAVYLASMLSRAPAVFASC